ncbi:peptide chain release factor 2 [Helcococcus kunzii]|nr:peptide chain release factor 2 [Helcococcus kunzii]MCT1796286.1 peptide chain release factor 2 [Helcococcus kunzii]MCT1989144.1 peptide chain release factor 2 [Helcococcus kunzii]
MKDLGDSLDIANKKEKLIELQKKSYENDFWDDSDKAQAIMIEINALKDTTENYSNLSRDIQALRDLLDLMSVEEFIEMQDDLTSDLLKTKEGISKLKIETLLSGEYDSNNAIMSIHAGSGGLEATDWAGMLYRMYTRWMDSKKYKYEIAEYNNEEGGGIKSVTLMVKGKNAYGYLKAERGVHRLVRISPFDSNARRHTSFASVDVYPEIDHDTEIEIDEKDLRIDTYRSSGAGGQHVNTTDSAVRITHIPTGVTVSCQTERSQIQNRETAMSMLKAKLVQIKEEEHKEKIEDIQGKYSQISWGSQIRSYVFQPYTLVKDHRTNYEVGNIEKVMDGDLDDFINAYLNMKEV